MIEFKMYNFEDFEDERLGSFLFGKRMWVFIEKGNEIYIL